MSSAPPPRTARPGCFVTHLEAAIDGTRLPAGELRNIHEGRPLWVRYDLPAVARSWSKEALATRPPDLWRYRELLPMPEGLTLATLGEEMTPLLPCPRLGRRLGAEDLWVKDESHLPTGSFKSRGMALAVSMARGFGVRRVALPSAGNAGGAAAAYAARAGIEAVVFLPRDTPLIHRLECRLAGASVELVDGLIDDCALLVRERSEEMGWFDLSTLREPYRLEGKKTMGLELAEQLGWRLPDVILYPTGGGTGLIGIWKAFQELREIGWLEGERLPRLVAVQSEGCAPIVRAFEAGERFAERFEGAQTMALGLRVPAAIGDFMILDALRESGGRAVAVEEGRIPEWMRLGAASEGIAFCPEAAACLGALERLTAERWIGPHERVALFNTGAAWKSPDAAEAAADRVEHAPS